MEGTYWITLFDVFEIFFINMPETLLSPHPPSPAPPKLRRGRLGWNMSGFPIVRSPNPFDENPRCAL